MKQKFYNLIRYHKQDREMKANDLKNYKFVKMILNY